MLSKNMKALQTARTQEITRIQDFPVDLEMIGKACKRTGFSQDQLKAIVRNKSRVVRLLPNTPVQDAYLMGEIKKVAHAYGGEKDLPIVVQKECLKALRNEFRSLSVSEVWTAFRLHSAGELEDRKGKGEMYGGKMSAKTFIAVLSAWNKYKAAAVLQYVNAVYEKRMKEIEEERASKMKETFWPQVISTIEKLREEGQDWRECPLYIFDSLRKRGLIPGLEKEEVWMPIWTDARKLARMDYESRLGEDYTKRGKIRLVGEVAMKAATAKMEEMEKRIAKKIALFRLVVQNDGFDLEQLATLTAGE